MTTNLETLFDFGCIDTPTWRQPRLVERTPAGDGNLHEVFEVDGELIIVDSWSAEWSEEEVTVELPVPQLD